MNKFSLFKNPMKISIQTRMSLIIVCTTTIIFIGFSFYNYINAYFAMKIELSEMVNFWSSHLVKSLEIPVWDYNTKSIKELINSTMIEKNVFAIVVKNNKGDVLSGSIRDNDWNIIDTHKDLIETDYFKRQDILRDDKKIGSLEISLSNKVMLEKLKKDAIYRFIIVVLVLNVSLIISLFFIIKISILSPINKIINGVRNIASGNLDKSIRLRRSDEIGQLSIDIDIMRSEIKNNLDIVQEKSEALLKAKERAEENEYRLKTLSDNIPNGLVYQIDSGIDGKQRRFSYISAGIERLHEITITDALNDAMLIYKQVVDEQNILAERESLAVQNMAPFSFEAKVKLPSGETRWRLFNSAPRRLHNKHIVWDGVEIDITDRKRTEENLIIKDCALSSSINGIAIFNMDGNLIYANQSFKSMWGFNQDDEIIGMHVTEFWYEKDKAKETIKKISSLSYYIGEFKAIRNDSSSFDALLSASIVKNQNGIPISTMTSFLDISEQRKLEAQLSNAQKLESIGILAGGIAHDFNNLLGVILGNISYALSTIDCNETLYEILQDAQTGTKQAQSLTQQLLTFSKGGSPVKKEADLREILKESALFVSRGSKVHCEFILSEDLWTVAVDSGQMNQAISNLIINAIQAMPEGGIIQISAENKTILPEDNFILSSGDYVKMTIKDSGIGISDKHISKIFDPYFTTKQKGNGLGLSTTYSIIKRHNGQIFVESTLGKGTIFFIYLPATESKNLNENQKEPSIRHIGHGKILIMDDQDMLLNMARRLFGLIGYKTSSAKDGKQAIEMYKEALLSSEPFDLVILDLTVPGGMGGSEAISELLKINPNIKAIVSSGYSNDPIMANYQDYGFCGVLAKPFTKAEIEETLNLIFQKKISDGLKIE